MLERGKQLIHLNQRRPMRRSQLLNRSDAVGEFLLQVEGHPRHFHLLNLGCVYIRHPDDTLAHAAKHSLRVIRIEKCGEILGIILGVYPESDEITSVSHWRRSTIDGCFPDKFSAVCAVK